MLPRMSARAQLTIIGLCIAVVLLSSADRTPKQFALAVGIMIVVTLFLFPSRCLIRKGNRRLCTNRAYGALGCCGIHRWRKVSWAIRRPAAPRQPVATSARVTGIRLTRPAPLPVDPVKDFAYWVLFVCGIASGIAAVVSLLT